MGMQMMSFGLYDDKLNISTDSSNLEGNVAYKQDSRNNSARKHKLSIESEVKTKKLKDTQEIF